MKFEEFIKEELGKDIKFESPRDAWINWLNDYAKKEQRVVPLAADLGSSTKTTKFEKESPPNEHMQCGIAEAHMMGEAAGFASRGWVVFPSTFAVFAAGRAFDTIRNTINYNSKDICMNVNIIATHGGLATGEDGYSHQALEDIALMRTLPGMSVVAPADVIELESVLEKAVDDPTPWYIRIPRVNLPTIMPENYEFKLGKAYELKPGKDCTIAAIGLHVSLALVAAKWLEKRGIDARVLNCSSVKPLDEEMILKENNYIVTCEDHTAVGGLGEAVSGVVTRNKPMYVRHIAIQDVFTESGGPEDLYDTYGLLPQDIYAEVSSLFGCKGFQPEMAQQPSIQRTTKRATIPFQEQR